MTLLELLLKIVTLIKEYDSILAITVAVILSCIQFSKIEINPWSALFGWIGNLTTANVNKRLDNLEKKIEDEEQKHTDGNTFLLKKIDEIQNKLDSHIQESSEKDMRDRRIAILDYANSILNGRNHTKEEYKYMIGECDKYEMDCKEKKIINSVAEEAIKAIKSSYSEKLKEGSFL